MTKFRQHQIFLPEIFSHNNLIPESDYYVDCFNTLIHESEYYVNCFNTLIRESDYFSLCFIKPKKMGDLPHPISRDEKIHRGHKILGSFDDLFSWMLISEKYFLLTKRRDKKFWRFAEARCFSEQISVRSRVNKYQSQLLVVLFLAQNLFDEVFGVLRGIDIALADVVKSLLNAAPALADVKIQYFLK